MSAPVMLLLLLLWKYVHKIWWTFLFLLRPSNFVIFFPKNLVHINYFFRMGWKKSKVKSISQYQYFKKCRKSADACASQCIRGIIVIDVWRFQIDTCKSKNAATVRNRGKCMSQDDWKDEVRTTHFFLSKLKKKPTEMQQHFLVLEDLLNFKWLLVQIDIATKNLQLQSVCKSSVLLAFVSRKIDDIVLWLTDDVHTLSFTVTNKNMC